MTAYDPNNIFAKILRGEILSEIDSGDREFWATEEDGGVIVREEEVAEEKGVR